MRILIPFFIAIICFSMFYCTQDNPESPNQNPDPTGRLIVKSIPSGARIYLLGTDTGKNTPDSIEYLQPGNYDAFLYLQYYDTAYFTATVYKNLTSTKEISLHDGLPFVDIVLDYSIRYGGDSVQFNYKLNQDILMDSIIVERPTDGSGNYIRDKYNYNSELLVWIDQFGIPIKYFLPSSHLGQQNFPRIQNFTYWFKFYGKKAYGAKVIFFILYSQGM